MAASYRNGIDFIAQNDEVSCLDEDVISGFISVVLMAELFGKTPQEVAKAVVRRRKKLENWGVVEWDS